MESIQLYPNIISSGGLLVLWAISETLHKNITVLNRRRKCSASQIQSNRKILVLSPIHLPPGVYIHQLSNLQICHMMRVFGP